MSKAKSGAAPKRMRRPNVEGIEQRAKEHLPCEAPGYCDGDGGKSGRFCLRCVSRIGVHILVDYIRFLEARDARRRGGTVKRE